MVNISKFLDPIVSTVINPLLVLLTALAGFYFIWGVAGLIWGADDASAQSKAKMHILYGVIGLFIMISAYGIVRLIAATVGVEDPYTTTGFQGFK